MITKKQIVEWYFERGNLPAETIPDDLTTLCNLVNDEIRYGDIYLDDLREFNAPNKVIQLRCKRWKQCIWLYFSQLSDKLHWECYKISGVSLKLPTKREYVETYV